jgi:hypothetical protein
MTVKNKQQTAAQLLIRSLVQQKVKYIFGIPGPRPPAASEFDMK